jgi:UDP-N-acetylglucosamine--N-acetylmuramyl-(pentapeptide) pyrophosphoryl-undecaprenol N-acetylglucosamine transferase
VSFPALFAARILGIPVVIHESDSKPGKVNAWAGKFAQKIAVSYPDAASYFKPEKTAYTGNPIRKEIEDPQVSGSHEFFKFTKDIPTIFIIGGSQGARFINSAIMDALPELVKRYQVIHQTGINNISVIKETSAVVLLNSQHKDRYFPIPYLSAYTSYGRRCDVIVSRGLTIFEIASWGRASIIIPYLNQKS